MVEKLGSGPSFSKDDPTELVDIVPVPLVTGSKIRTPSSTKMRGMSSRLSRKSRESLDELFWDRLILGRSIGFRFNGFFCHDYFWKWVIFGRFFYSISLNVFSQGGRFPFFFGVIGRKELDRLLNVKWWTVKAKNFQESKNFWPTEFLDALKVAKFLKDFFTKRPRVLIKSVRNYF